MQLLYIFCQNWILVIENLTTLVVLMESACGHQASHFWHSECSPAASVSPWFQLKQHAPGNISPGGPWSSVPEWTTATTSSQQMVSEMLLYASRWLLFSHNFHALINVQNVFGIIYEPIQLYKKWTLLTQDKEMFIPTPKAWHIG